MRTCRRCGRGQPLSEFYVRRATGVDYYCKSCRRADSREWYRKNAERSKAAGRAWAERNRERSREIKQRHARTEKHRTRRRAYLAEWRAANPDRVKLYSWQSNARRKGLPRHSLGASDIAYLLADPCAYCGKPAGEVDHIVPLTRGGTSEADNLTSACRSCNARKHNKSLLTFLRDSLPG